MAPISLCFSCLVVSIQFGSNCPYGELLFCVKIFFIYIVKYSHRSDIGPSTFKL
jgi:hypothetical protein